MARTPTHVLSVSHGLPHSVVVRGLLSFKGRGNRLHLLIGEARFWQCVWDVKYCCGCFWNMQSFTEDFGGEVALNHAWENVLNVGPGVQGGNIQD